MTKDYPNARDCEHGQLRRACPICEVEARLAELVEAVRWERECEENTHCGWGKWWWEGCHELHEIRRAARAAVDALVGGE